MIAKARRMTLCGLITAVGTIAPLDLPARDVGTGEETELVAEVDGVALEVQVYEPAGCARPSILILLHGNGRSAASYLQASQGIADRACLTVYAPLFDRDRFPNSSYHRGGLIRDGKLLPRDDWTVDLATDLTEWARTREGQPDAAIYMFGHSAGGQFLSRIVAYDPPPNVERFVIANPSTYVLPSLTEPVPYGFGGLPGAEAALKAYLAAPITIYLGEEDTGDKDLTQTPEAERQGRNRLDRGERTFDAGRRMAAAHGWPFNWQLVHADNVGHSARDMLNAAEIGEAMGN